MINESTEPEKYNTEDSECTSEEVVVNPCAISLMNRDSTFAFLPCGHAQVCGNCGVNFESGDSYTTCRCFTTNKIQFF